MDDRSPPLSPTEKEVLEKVAYGATTREVAETLGIPVHEVRTHLERALNKLGADDRRPPPTPPAVA